MAEKIKIDLHTHPFRALAGPKGIRGVRDIEKAALAPLVEAVLGAGLQGIAITEQDNFNWGWTAALQIKELFPERDILVLPGREIEFRGQHFLQIYVPESARRRYSFFREREWLNILVHPGYYRPIDSAGLAGAAIDAVEEASLKGAFAAAEGLARERGIPLIQASDAQRLEQIGAKYLEIEADLRPAGRRRQGPRSGRF